MLEGIVNIELGSTWRRSWPILNNPWPYIEQLDVATKPTNWQKCWYFVVVQIGLLLWQKCVRVSYVVNLVFLIHVAATLVTILREVPYKGWVCYKSVWTNTVHLVFFICSLVHSLCNSWTDVFSLKNLPVDGHERPQQVGAVLCYMRFSTFVLVVAYFAVQSRH